jgi:hypothetical protein
MAKATKKKAPTAPERPAKAVAVKQTPPDQIKLNGIQAQRFATMANVPIKEVAGQTIAALQEKYKWIIDPNWFLFQWVCGQVVRWDPVSGTYLPCPNCTVHVMDTDCDFLFYAPFDYPWLWCFPIWCHQEEWATVVTDECGKFCVLIPRFDIDWVWRWKLQRYCFPEVLQSVSLGDLLTHLNVVAVPPPHIGPDPGPVEVVQSGISLDRLSALTGRETAKQILSSGSSSGFGNLKTAATALLDRPAFHHPVAPPTSAALQDLQKQHAKRGSAAVAELVKSSAKRNYNFDINRYIGPFPRWYCEWIIERELIPVLEVPDITFWVQQDVYGTGTLETIYQDGYFQIGWESGPLDNVTLHAADYARVTTTCQVPPVEGCDQAEIQFAGLMPATSNYIDANGYGWRLNPPHADGATLTGATRASVFPPSVIPPPDTPATAPFTATVQLYGCIGNPKAQYYRLLYSYNGGPTVPFVGLDWYLDPMPPIGPPLHGVPDPSGWYPVLATPTAWWPPFELLDWPTTSYPNGLYNISLELGDATKTGIYTSAPIPFLVDNSANAPLFLSLAWRVAGTTTWNYFPDFVCPQVFRPKGTDLEFRVEYQVSMSHLLKLTLGGSGCGGGVTIQTEASPNWSDPPGTDDPYAHWHTNWADNTVHNAAIFFLPAAALAGCYGFTLNAYSRAFNPSGGDASNPQAHDWYVDFASLNWNQADLSVAVVDV